MKAVDICLEKKIQMKKKNNQKIVRNISPENIQ